MCCVGGKFRAKGLCGRFCSGCWLQRLHPSMILFILTILWDFRLPLFCLPAPRPLRKSMESMKSMILWSCRPPSWPGASFIQPGRRAIIASIAIIAIYFNYFGSSCFVSRCWLKMLPPSRILLIPLILIILWKYGSIIAFRLLTYIDGRFYCKV